MSILALDLGTTTGYAISVNGKALMMSSCIDLSGDRFSGGGMRFLNFRRWLEKLHESVKVTEVLYEEVRRHRGVGAAHIYGGFQAQLTSWCEEKGIPYAGVPVGTIKKFATGKGNADKDAVIAAVKERWGFDPADDNEADAIALLQWRLQDITG